MKTVIKWSLFYVLGLAAGLLIVGPLIAIVFDAIGGFLTANRG